MASLLAALVSGKLILLLMAPLLLAGYAVLREPAALYFLLLFTIPLSTEFQLTSTLGTDLPDELLMWISTPLLLMLVWRNPKLMGKSMQDPILSLLLLMLLWTALTVSTSTVPLLSIKFFLAKCWYLVPFVLGTMIFLRDQQQIIKAGRWMVLAMLVAVLFILFRHAAEGFSFDSANRITQPFFRNHVNYGALLVCMVPVVYAFYSSGIRYSGWVLAVFLLALFLTYSRGAWIALPVGIIVVWAVRKSMLQWLIMAVMVFTVVSATWLLDNNRYLSYRPHYESTIYHDAFGDHLEATYRGQDLSTMERFHRWVAAVGMVRERWLTGFGPNSFYPAYQRYVVKDFRTYVSDNPERSTVHNYFLLLLTEQGIPGALLFIILLAMMLMRCQKLFHCTRDPFTRGLSLVIACILSMITVLIFLSDLIETDKIGSVFYISAGLLVVASAFNVKGIPETIAKEVE
jgi:O-antigen ligase